MSEMKERPILMSAPMIRALLSGAKNQTRRIMKVQPEEGGYVRVNGDNWNVCLAPDHYKDIQDIAWKTQGTHHVSHILKCPYGKIGDRLWVRETWAVSCAYDSYPPRDLTPHAGSVWYAAGGGFDFENGERGRTRSSMFMPRWASRITLEIAEVRVHRLQNISDDDCIAEGIGYVPQLGIMRACGWQDYSGNTVGFLSPRDSYRSLWESINGSGSWGLNPFCWCVSFKRVV